MDLRPTLIIALFTYDAPHWKTQQFLHELCSNGLKPEIIIASPWRHLSLPPCARVAVRHMPHHPRDMADTYGINYQVMPHEEWRGGYLGVIGAARILPKAVIDSFEVGILNLHPGRIPQNRGLSNITRAIREDWPQAVTAHLVDERIDAGTILMEREIDQLQDDEVWDLAERTIDVSVHMLVEAVWKSISHCGRPVPQDCGGYAPPMSKADELAAIAVWKERKVCNEPIGGKVSSPDIREG